jgi:arylformamidase
MTNLSLALADDPDAQMPLPFPAAVDYARTVMAWSREALPASVVATLGVAYGSHRLQRFDVYAPAGAQGAPVLVFWHGGGWTNGYREWVRFMAPHVTALGLVMVAPSYRLVTECPFPAAPDDALALLAHLQHTLPTWGGAARGLLLAGHSAGGHLAALTALRHTLWPRWGIAPDLVGGCLPISGIMDLHDPQPAPGGLEERVYTTVLRGLDPAQDGVFSPLCWSAGNRLPFDLSFGEHDSARVQRSNRRLLPLLQAQAGPATLTECAGLDHLQTHLALRDPAHPWYGRLRAMADPLA